MHENNRPQVMQRIAELERHFGTQLGPVLCKAFLNYCLANFEDLTALDQAIELVATHEVNYGKFPPFARFRELLDETRRVQGPAYQMAALPPSPEERGVQVDRWDEPYSKADVLRLKAKAQVSQFFRKDTTIAWGDRYLREAIVEAEMRGIPLELIGVVDTKAVPA